MIARNYVKFPDALMQQFELVFETAQQTFMNMGKKMRAIWSRLLTAPQPKVKKILPEWYVAMMARAKALARACKAAQMAI